MTEHTPGPWRAEPEYQDTEDALSDLRRGFWGNGKMVCMTVVASSVPSATREANARLIAAAPSLLAALDDVCIQYPLIHGEPVPAWIRNARAAIAKARGQT